MGSHKENFDITWNNFESRLSRSFSDIWTQGRFLDVTLAAMAEDGSMEALRAHKLILSASSPILRSLLEKQAALSPHLPVMLYLQSISARHLRLVLQFIYRGRVSLPKDELNDFLLVAKSLQIPLEDIEDQTIDKIPDKINPAPAKRAAQPGGETDQIKRPKLAKGTKKKKPNKEVKIKETFSLKREPHTPPSTPPDPELCEVVVNEYEDPLGTTPTNAKNDVPAPRRILADTASLKDAFMKENVTKTDGGFMCIPCDKLMTSNSGINRHVEDQHVRAGVRFRCPKCPYIAKNKNCLHSHVSRQHRDIATASLDYEQYALYQSD